MEKGTSPVVSRVGFHRGERLPVLGSTSAHGQPRPLLFLSARRCKRHGGEPVPQ